MPDLIQRRRAGHLSNVKFHLHHARISPSPFRRFHLLEAARYFDLFSKVEYAQTH